MGGGLGGTQHVVRGESPSSSDKVERFWLAAELAAWIVCVAYLCYAARDALFLAKSTIDHDNLLFFYPIYQFFSESLLQGRFPYWDPFTHGGSALYPALLQLRLLEPVSYLVLGLGAGVTDDLVTLFNWDRLARTLVGAVGTYVLLRPWAPHRGGRLILIPLVTWSSLVLAAFHQTAVVDQYITAPWFAHFLIRIVHERDSAWRNWIGLAICLGLSWQSYYFSGVWIFILFFTVGGIAFRREDVRALTNQRRLVPKLATACAVAGLMIMPNAVVLSERDSFIVPARMVDHRVEGHSPLGGPLQYEPTRSVREIDSLMMPYSLVQYTGTFSSPWDFVQLLAPEGNRFARGDASGAAFGMPSEAFMYVGLLGYAGALFGLVAGRHPLKGVWLVTTVGFGVLLLGPAGGLHRLLYVYPPLWVTRHTHALVSFFVMGLLFFFVIGLNRLVEGPFQGSDRLAAQVRHGWRRGGPVALTLILGLVLFLLGSAVLRKVASPRILPYFNWEATLVVLILLIFWGAYRWGGAVTAMMAALLAHVALVAQHSPRDSGTVTRVLVLMALPLLVLVITRLTFPRLWKVALLASGVVLVVDLAGYVNDSSWLWHWRRPDDALRIVAKPQYPVVPEPRVVVLPSMDMYQFYPQPLRYLTLLARRPAAFSSLMYGPDAPEPYFRSSAVHVENQDLSAWHMGEGGWRLDSWKAVPPESVLPEPGSGPPGATGAARLLRRANGVSALRLEFEVPGDLVQLWVKVPTLSGNAVSGAVEVELAFGAARVSRAYSDPGKWEILTVTAHGRGRAELTVRLKPTATDDVLIGPVTTRVRTLGKPTGEHFDLGLVRSSARWNSFFMPARYFAMINGSLPDPALEEILAIAQPLVQFRPSARVASADAMITELRSQPEDEMRRTLREVVYLHENPPNTSLSRKTSGAAGSVRVVQYDHQAMRIRVDSTEGGYIVVAQGYDRHWKAFEAGRSVPVIPANLAFSSIPVEPGGYEIDLRYSPDGFRMAVLLYFGLAGGGVAFLLVAGLRGRGSSTCRRGNVQGQ